MSVLLNGRLSFIARAVCRTKLHVKQAVSLSSWPNGSTTPMSDGLSQRKTKIEEQKANLHSKSKVLEASSNLINIGDINSLSVYDLQEAYRTTKTKVYGENCFFWVPHILPPPV